MTDKKLYCARRPMRVSLPRMPVQVLRYVISTLLHFILTLISSASGGMSTVWTSRFSVKSVIDFTISATSYVSLLRLYAFAGHIE